MPINEMIKKISNSLPIIDDQLLYLECFISDICRKVDYINLYLSYLALHPIYIKMIVKYLWKVLENSICCFVCNF